MADEYTDDTAELQVGHCFADVVEPATWSAFDRAERGTRFTVSGKIAPRESSGQAGVEARAFGWASLRVGLVVPVVSPVRPAVNGLYEVVSAGTSEDQSWPSMGGGVSAQDPNSVPQERQVTVGLALLTGATAEVETTVWLAQYHPTIAPVVYSSGAPRFGYPGDILAPTPAGVSFSIDATRSVVRPNGMTARVQTGAISNNVRATVTSSCGSSEYLAGSPRVEVFAGGTWWPMHGQPPAGYPIRVHNEIVGLELGFPAVAAVPGRNGWPAIAARPQESMKTIRYVNGLPSLSTEFFWNDSGGFMFQAPMTGITVEQADSEVLRFRFTSPRLAIDLSRQTEARGFTCLFRRGVPGYWLWLTKNAELNVGTVFGSAQMDNASNVVGAVTSTFTYTGQKVVTNTTVSGSSFKVNGMGPLVRIEDNASNSRTRSWAHVTSKVVGR